MHLSHRRLRYSSYIRTEPNITMTLCRFSALHCSCRKMEGRREASSPLLGVRQSPLGRQLAEPVPILCTPETLAQGACQDKEEEKLERDMFQQSPADRWRQLSAGQVRAVLGLLWPIAGMCGQRIRDGPYPTPQSHAVPKVNWMQQIIQPYIFFSSCWAQSCSP